MSCYDENGRSVDLVAYEASAVQLINHNQYLEIKYKVKCVAMCFHMEDSATWAVYARLRSQFECKSVSKLPANCMDEAMKMLGVMKQQAQRFKCSVVDFEKQFFCTLGTGDNFDSQNFELIE